MGVTEAYVQHHKKYAGFQYQPILKELAERYQQQNSQRDNRFLEIGSGPGFLTQRIADKYPQAEINALELSGDMIDIAKTVVVK